MERLLGSGPAMAEAAAAHASLPEAPLAADPPPASVDWQAKGAVGPVKDRKPAAAPPVQHSLRSAALLGRGRLRRVLGILDHGRCGGRLSDRDGHAPLPL